MSLSKAISEAISSRSEADILKSLGYQEDDGKAAHGLSVAAREGDYGLVSGEYDSKYSSKEFLAKLCEILGIDLADYQQEIDIVSEQHSKRAYWRGANIVAKTDGLDSYGSIDNARVQSAERSIAVSFEDAVAYENGDTEAVMKLIADHYRKKDGVVTQRKDPIDYYLLCLGEDKPIRIEVPDKN